RNLISGNLGDGIALSRGGGVGSIPSANVIEGNFIGTDITGATSTGTDGKPLGNNICVDVQEGSGNTITGTTTAAGNVSSGSGFGGVCLGTTTGAPTTVTGNLVQGNLIGTDATGSRALANATGVIVNGGDPVGVGNNLIGGATAAARNVISGNQGFGVQVSR